MGIKEEFDRIQNAENIIIYGTGIMANAFYQVMQSQLPIRCFMVTDNPQTELMYEKYPVISVLEAPQQYKDDLVVVTVIDKYISEIKEVLLEYGFSNVIPLTFESRLWQYIREPYIRDVMEQSNLSYRRLEDSLISTDGTATNKCNLYQVKCHLDAETSGLKDAYDYELPIQAGADLTDIRVADILDNRGENISLKNKQFCELTAWYWVWKNVNTDYVGICHYRRHFDLKKEQLESLTANKVDVVLTVPILNFPNVKCMYEHDHLLSDWDVMMQAITRLQPEYIETAQKVSDSQFYFGYNMIIARKDIFDTYCNWLFPILVYCEEHAAQREQGYQNRFVGFLAERLLTIYFIHNWETYHVAVADKVFLQKD